MATPYSEMNKEEIQAFVGEARFGVVGTNRANGPPQLTPVWYLYQDQKIYISVSVESAKYKNLRRYPYASICIAGTSPDARSVTFSGPVELYRSGCEPWVDDIDWKLVRRYYSSDEDAREYLESESESEPGAGESALAVLIPNRIIAHDYN